VRPRTPSAAAALRAGVALGREGCALCFTDRSTITNAPAPSGDNKDSSSSIPDALPVAGDSDWRAFRARLAAMEAAPEAGSSAPKFQEGRWAHTVPVPETGCILLAHPSMFGVRGRGVLNVAVGVVLGTVPEQSLSSLCIMHSSTLTPPHTDSPPPPREQVSQTYFKLAAILILECNDGGALGIILNRPTQHQLRGVQFSSQETAAFGDNKLWMGGDVGESSVIVVTTSAAVQDATEIAAGIRVCTISAAAAAVAAGKASPGEFRFFACYSGWGPGQLQRECKAGVWFVASVGSQLALDEGLAAGPELWHEILTTMGGELVSCYAG